MVSEKEYKQLSLFEKKEPWVTLKDAFRDLETAPGEYFEASYSTIYMSRNRKKNLDK